MKREIMRKREAHQCYEAHQRQSTSLSRHRFSTVTAAFAAAAHRLRRLDSASVAGRVADDLPPSASQPALISVVPRASRAEQRRFPSSSTAACTTKDSQSQNGE
uniref:Uncharacterized protein n=1 Tax=Oryza punctata TaxID=4537 RepID=A0A0E0M145_ORYPU